MRETYLRAQVVGLTIFAGSALGIHVGTRPVRTEELAVADTIVRVTVWLRQHGQPAFHQHYR
jgi:hypothetical protein